MSTSNKNPLNPNSLAAEGIQGAGGVSHTSAYEVDLIAGVQESLYLNAEALSLRDSGDGLSEPKLSGNRCQCAACGQFFSRVRVFDRHRVGPYGKKGQPCGRRCLTSAEMAARGWHVNADGLWVMDAMGDAGKSRLRGNGKRAEAQEGVDGLLPVDSDLPAPCVLVKGVGNGQAS